MVWTLVTGAAKGLGAEICLTLAEDGYNVIIHYKNSRKEAEIIAEECRKRGVKAEILCADFSDNEGIKKLLENIQVKSLNIQNLVNNVGNLFRSPPSETPLEVWYDLFQTNLHAPYALIQGLLPSIKKQKGSIINIGTVGVSESKADVGHCAYSITKRALYLLTKGLAKELAKDHVRVNMVSPGELENSVTLSKNGTTLPMGRAGKLKEVANVILFLLQENNGYITGQNIEVSGGYAL